MLNSLVLHCNRPFLNSQVPSSALHICPTNGGTGHGTNGYYVLAVHAEACLLHMVHHKSHIYIFHVTRVLVRYLQM